MTGVATLELAKAARWQFVAHLNYGDHAVYVRRHADIPELAVNQTVAKNRRFKGRTGTLFLVRGFADAFEDLQAAVDAVNALRAAAEEAA